MYYHFPMYTGFDNFRNAVLSGAAAAPAGSFHDFSSAAWNLRAPGIYSLNKIFKTGGLAPGKIYIVRSKQ
jgi:hypothetical protein